MNHEAGRVVESKSICLVSRVWTIKYAENKREEV